MQLVNDKSDTMAYSLISVFQTEGQRESIELTMFAEVQVCAIIEDGTSRAECRANGMLAWEMLGVLGRPWKLESGEHSQPESDDASGQIPVLWQDSATRSYTQELLRLARQHGCLVVTRQWCVH